MVMRQLRAEHAYILESNFIFVEELIAIRNRQSTLQPPDDLEINVRWSCCANQLVQHFKRWNGHGEALDTISGRHNLVHVAMEALSLWTLERVGAGTDDRPSTRAVQVIAATRPEIARGDL